MESLQGLKNNEVLPDWAKLYDDYLSAERAVEAALVNGNLTSSQAWRSQPAELSLRDLASTAFASRGPTASGHAAPRQPSTGANIADALAAQINALSGGAQSFDAIPDASQVEEELLRRLEGGATGNAANRYDPNGDLRSGYTMPPAHLSSSSSGVSWPEPAPALFAAGPGGPQAYPGSAGGPQRVVQPGNLPVSSAGRQPANVFWQQMEQQQSRSRPQAGAWEAPGRSATRTKRPAAASPYSSAYGRGEPLVNVRASAPQPSPHDSGRQPRPQPQPITDLLHSLSLRAGAAGTAPRSPPYSSNRGAAVSSSQPALPARELASPQYAGPRARPSSGTSPRHTTSTYTALHSQRQSPPRQSLPSAPREALFAALHRGVSPHRLRVLLSQQRSQSPPTRPVSASVPQAAWQAAAAPPAPGGARTSPSQQRPPIVPYTNMLLAQQYQQQPAGPSKGVQSVLQHPRAWGPPQSARAVGDSRASQRNHAVRTSAPAPSPSPAAHQHWQDRQQQQQHAPVGHHAGRVPGSPGEYGRPRWSQEGDAGPADQGPGAPQRARSVSPGAYRRHGSRVAASVGDGVYEQLLAARPPGAVQKGSVPGGVDAVRAVSVGRQREEQRPAQPGSARAGQHAWVQQQQQMQQQHHGGGGVSQGQPGPDRVLTASPSMDRNPELFISPQQYRQYAGMGPGGAEPEPVDSRLATAAADYSRYEAHQQAQQWQQQQQPTVQATVSGSGGEVGAPAGNGPTPPGGDLLAAMGLRDVRQMQQRLSLELDLAAAVGDGGRWAAPYAAATAAGHLGGAPAAAGHGDVRASLRPPSGYGEGQAAAAANLGRPTRGSHGAGDGFSMPNDMAAALEGGAMPYPLAPSAASEAGVVDAGESFAAWAAAPTGAGVGGGGVGARQLGFDGLLEPLDDLVEFEFQEALIAGLLQGAVSPAQALPGTRPPGAAAPGPRDSPAESGSPPGPTRSVAARPGAPLIRASWPVQQQQQQRSGSPGGSHGSPSGPHGGSSVSSSAATAPWRPPGQLPYSPRAQQYLAMRQQQMQQQQQLAHQLRVAEGAQAQQQQEQQQGSPSRQREQSPQHAPRHAGVTAAEGLQPNGRGLQPSAAQGAAAGSPPAAAANSAASASTSTTNATTAAAAAAAMGGLLDLGSLTAQLAAMDTGSLEAIRGYASGYIDGRVQALPQLGKVRSEVVKAAVLRLVEEAIQARRAAAGAAVGATQAAQAPVRPLSPATARTQATQSSSQHTAATAPPGSSRPAPADAAQTHVAHAVQLSSDASWGIAPAAAAAAAVAAAPGASPQGASPHRSSLSGTAATAGALPPLPDSRSPDGPPAQHASGVGTGELLPPRELSLAVSFHSGTNAASSSTLSSVGGGAPHEGHVPGTAVRAIGGHVHAVHAGAAPSQSLQSGAQYGSQAISPGSPALPANGGSSNVGDAADGAAASAHLSEEATAPSTLSAVAAVPASSRSASGAVGVATPSDSESPGDVPSSVPQLEPAPLHTHPRTPLQGGSVQLPAVPVATLAGLEEQQQQQQGLASSGSTAHVVREGPVASVLQHVEQQELQEAGPYQQQTELAAAAAVAAAAPVVSFPQMPASPLQPPAAPGSAGGSPGLATAADAAGEVPVVTLGATGSVASTICYSSPSGSGADEPSSRAAEQAGEEGMLDSTAAHGEGEEEEEAVSGLLGGGQRSWGSVHEHEPEHEAEEEREEAAWGSTAHGGDAASHGQGGVEETPHAGAVESAAVAAVGGMLAGDGRAHVDEGPVDSGHGGSTAACLAGPALEAAVLEGGSTSRTEGSPDTVAAPEQSQLPPTVPELGELGGAAHTGISAAAATEQAVSARPAPLPSSAQPSADSPAPAAASTPTRRRTHSGSGATTPGALAAVSRTAATCASGPSSGRTGAVHGSTTSNTNHLSTGHTSNIANARRSNPGAAPSGPSSTTPNAASSSPAPGKMRTTSGRATTLLSAAVSPSASGSKHARRTSSSGGASSLVTSVPSTAASRTPSSRQLPSASASSSVPTRSHTTHVALSKPGVHTTFGSTPASPATNRPPKLQALGSLPPTPAGTPMSTASKHSHTHGTSQGGVHTTATSIGGAPHELLPAGASPSVSGTSARRSTEQMLPAGSAFSSQPRAAVAAAAAAHREAAAAAGTASSAGVAGGVMGTRSSLESESLRFLAQLDAALAASGGGAGPGDTATHGEEVQGPAVEHSVGVSTGAEAPGEVGPAADAGQAALLPSASPPSPPPEADDSPVMPPSLGLEQLPLLQPVHAADRAEGEASAPASPSPLVLSPGSISVPAHVHATAVAAGLTAGALQQQGAPLHSALSPPPQAEDSTPQSPMPGLGPTPALPLPGGEQPTGPHGASQPEGVQRPHRGSQQGEVLVRGVELAAYGAGQARVAEAQEQVVTRTASGAADATAVVSGSEVDAGSRQAGGELNFGGAVATAAAAGTGELVGGEGAVHAAAGSTGGQLLVRPVDAAVALDGSDEQQASGAGLLGQAAEEACSAGAVVGALEVGAEAVVVAPQAEAFTEAGLPGAEAALLPLHDTASPAGAQALAHAAEAAEAPGGPQDPAVEGAAVVPGSAGPGAAPDGALLPPASGTEGSPSAVAGLPQATAADGAVQPRMAAAAGAIAVAGPNQSAIPESSPAQLPVPVVAAPAAATVGAQAEAAPEAVAAPTVPSPVPGAREGSQHLTPASAPEEPAAACAPSGALPADTAPEALAPNLASGDATQPASQPAAIISSAAPLSLPTDASSPVAIDATTRAEPQAMDSTAAVQPTAPQAAGADGTGDPAPVADAADAAATEAPAAAAAVAAAGRAAGSQPELPVLRSVRGSSASLGSEAGTPGGSGAATPTRRGRDARSIEPVLAELRATKALVAAGDPDGAHAQRMTELLDQLDSYRRGVERRHGPQHAIASQLRLLHADMTKWLKTVTAAAAAAAGATVAPTAAASAPGAGAPAAAGSSAAVGVGGGVDSAVGVAANPAIDGGSGQGGAHKLLDMPPAAAAQPAAAPAAFVAPQPAQAAGTLTSEITPAPIAPQTQQQQLQAQQQEPGVGLSAALARRESQSSVHTDATLFDGGAAGASTGVSTPRDSLAGIATPGSNSPDGFSFSPQHQQHYQQQQQLRAQRSSSSSVGAASMAGASMGAGSSASMAAAGPSAPGVAMAPPVAAAPPTRVTASQAATAQANGQGASTSSQGLDWSKYGLGFGGGAGSGSGTAGMGQAAAASGVGHGAMSGMQQQQQRQGHMGGLSQQQQYGSFPAAGGVVPGVAGMGMGMGMGMAGGGGGMAGPSGQPQMSLMDLANQLNSRAMQQQGQQRSAGMGMMSQGGAGMGTGMGGGMGMGVGMGMGMGPGGSASMGAMGPGTTMMMPAGMRSVSHGGPHVGAGGGGAGAQQQAAAGQGGSGGGAAEGKKAGSLKKKLGGLFGGGKK